jgi:hypothetical protein
MNGLFLGTVEQDPPMPAYQITSPHGSLNTSPYLGIEVLSRGDVFAAATWILKTAGRMRFAQCFQSTDEGFSASLDSSDVIE